MIFEIGAPDYIGIDCLEHLLHVWWSESLVRILLKSHFSHLGFLKLPKGESFTPVLGYDLRLCRTTIRREKRFIQNFHV